LDLTIGDIFLPGREPDNRGGVNCPLDSYALEPGHTAVVTGFEEISLPSDIAGISFPPSRVSFKGILMTNPGHLDPGYQGKVRFAIINMGKYSYCLNRGDIIVTILLFKLENPPKKSWADRNPEGRQNDPNQIDVNRLSPDFLNLGERLKRIARREMDRTERKTILSFILITFAAILLSAVAVNFFSGPDADELNRRISILESRITTIETEQFLDRIIEHLD
jgi:dUTPase